MFYGSHCIFFKDHVEMENRRFSFIFNIFFNPRDRSIFEIEKQYADIKKNYPQIKKCLSAKVYLL